MPRLPGREPTAKKYNFEDLVVGSFVMGHETWYWRRPCVVKGCDHRMGPDTTKPKWVEWKSCDEKQLPAYAAVEATLEAAGLVCPCHVAEILEWT